MRVLIVGAQGVGRALARDLLHDHHDVRLLDESAEALARLPAGMASHAVHGSPLHRDTLAAALAECDGLAAVSPDDALNIVVAIGARQELGVPRVVAVIGNPARAEALAGTGVHVYCPTARTAHELHFTLVRTGIESELLLADGLGVYRAELPLQLSGRALREVERPGHLHAIAVERAGRVVMAMPDLMLAEGDVLHVAAARRTDLANLMGP